MSSLKNRIERIKEDFAKDGKRTDLNVEFKEYAYEVIGQEVAQALHEWILYNEKHIAVKIDAKTKMVKELRLLYEHVKDEKERSRILKKILDLS